MAAKRAFAAVQILIGGLMIAFGTHCSLAFLRNYWPSGGSQSVNSAISFLAITAFFGAMPVTCGILFILSGRRLGRTARMRGDDQ